MSASTFGRTLALSCLVLIASRQAHAAQDYLVVEHVRNLVVYNRYQQESTAEDREALQPCAPIRILQPDDLFGDGFTRCMQVEIDGEVFYLLKGANGALSRSGPLGFEETFANTITFLDTVVVLRALSIRLSPINSTPRYLPVGQRVVRIFQHRNATYCKTVSSPPAYGWIDFRDRGEGRDWSKLAQVSSISDVIPRGIAQKVQARLDEANAVLARLFSYFNSETREQKEPPQWRMKFSERTIVCTLVGTRSPRQFQQSTDYLVKDIQNIALGSSLGVSYSPGTIDIRVR
jgi:hypothetical protein